LVASFIDFGSDTGFSGRWFWIWFFKGFSGLGFSGLFGFGFLGLLDLVFLDSWILVFQILVFDPVNQSIDNTNLVFQAGRYKSTNAGFTSFTNYAGPGNFTHFLFVLSLNYYINYYKALIFIILSVYPP